MDVASEAFYYSAPTVAHLVALPAPRAGRFTCGLAKPAPWPLLVKRAPLVIPALERSEFTANRFGADSAL